MKYWDTSAILRAWKEGWIPGAGITRSHSVSEWVAIQTGRGLVYQQPNGEWVKRNLSPADAAREARRMFANFVFRDLNGDQTLAAVEALAKMPNIKGADVHDFMHARAAELHNAESVVTLNLNDFSRMNGTAAGTSKRPLKTWPDCLRRGFKSKAIDTQDPALQPHGQTPWSALRIPVKAVIGRPELIWIPR